MTVKELKGLLESYNDDDEVFMEQPTHDYWRAVAARPVQEARIEEVKHSNYHNSLVICSEEDYTEDMKSVLVLQ